MDLRCIDDRTTDAGSTETRHAYGFRQSLIDRDDTCVVTNQPSTRLCEGTHYFPHSKGSEVRCFT